MRRLEGYQVLRNRNYRLFWLGQWVSLIGTWMQTVTQAWLLTRLGASPLALGMLGAATSAPVLVLVLLGGLVSDHLDRRRVIMATQTLSLLQASLMAALTLAGIVRPWQIISLAAVLGAINAFDIPARQAFVVELVGPEHLPNAIALNSTGFNVARVVGPAIGGLLTAAVGEGVCFLVNAVSYLAVLWSLWRITLPRRASAPRLAVSQRHALAAGFSYVIERPDLRSILALVGVVSAISISYRNFLPAMARDVLQIGAWRYGLLMAAAGVGAGLGGFLLAGARLGSDSRRRLLPAGLACFGLSLGAFALSRSFGLSLVLLAFVGAGGIVYFNATNTFVQLSADDQHRGRVMSLYTLMHQGTSTLGSLVLGAIANRFGTPAALEAGAVVCLGAMSAFSGRGLLAVAGRLTSRAGRSASPSSDRSALPRRQ